MLDSVFDVLPVTIHKLIKALPSSVQAGLEEIRIRENRPLEVIYQGQYRFVSEDGELLEEAGSAYLTPREQCAKLLDLLTNHSLYALEEELKRGYITIRGGHRVGLAGRTILEDGNVKQVRDISSFNIRIAREIQGNAVHIVPFLLDSSIQSVHHTLIISQPQLGKTTLLRDISRILSYGIHRIKPKGLKIGIVDERSELAACVKGVPTFDVGPRTDVLDGCPKAEGMMMLIRSMSPDILIVDEIGREEDAFAIDEATHAGIRVIATAHGKSLDDIRQRPILRRLIEAGTFQRMIVIERSREQDARRAYQIYDAQGKQLGTYVQQTRMERLTSS